jgi:hypothetical protein
MECDPISHLVRVFYNNVMKVVMMGCTCGSGGRIKICAEFH